MYSGDPRVCSYTKKYYCTQCHVNEESYVPAKIVFNWDWAKYKGTHSIIIFIGLCWSYVLFGGITSII